MREGAAAEFAEWVAALNAYLDGRASDLRLPVHVRATAFQQMVWDYLRRMPAGRSQSYKEVAEALVQPSLCVRIYAEVAEDRVAPGAQAEHSQVDNRSLS